MDFLIFPKCSSIYFMIPYFMAQSKQVHKILVKKLDFQLNIFAGNVYSFVIIHFYVAFLLLESKKEKRIETYEGLFIWSWS